MRELKISSETGRYLDLPFSNKWNTLCVYCPIRIQYVSTDDEKMRLVIPDGFKGSLKYIEQDDGMLHLMAITKDDAHCSQDLTIEIAHRQLIYLFLSSGSSFSATGAIPLEKISVHDNSQVDLRKASIVSDQFMVDLYADAQCQMGPLQCQQFQIRQHDSSYLNAVQIRCNGTITLQTKAACKTNLSGQADRLETEQFGNSWVMAGNLHTSSVRAVVCNFSKLSCHTPELAYYHSEKAYIHNALPECVTRQIEGIATYKWLREVTLEDVIQMILHLKPSDHDHQHTLYVQRNVQDQYRFSRWYTLFRREEHDGKIVLVGGCHKLRVDYPEQCLLSNLISIARRTNSLWIDVPMDGIDWEAIPEVKERLLQQIPCRYECLDD